MRNCSVEKRWQTIGFFISFRFHRVGQVSSAMGNLLLDGSVHWKDKEIILVFEELLRAIKVQLTIARDAHKVRKYGF